MIYRLLPIRIAFALTRNMPKTMAKKSYTKRIKVTKTGKLLRRKQGLGHAKAKKKRKIVSQKRNLAEVSGSDQSNIEKNANR